MTKGVWFAGKKLPDLTPAQEAVVRKWAEWTPIFISGNREYAWIEKKLFFVKGFDGDADPKWIYRCAICKEEHYDDVFFDCQNLECLTLREIAR